MIAANEMRPGGSDPCRVGSHKFLDVEETFELQTHPHDLLFLNLLPVGPGNPHWRCLGL